MKATVTATDQAGNSATYDSPLLKIDKTPPIIVLSTPPEGATYLHNAAVAANFSCSDALSQIGTCSGTVASGPNIATTPVGPKTFGVKATDMAGNATTETPGYAVRYGFAGFFQLVDKLPILNVASGG